MTKSFVVAVKDRAVDAFSRPFFVPSVPAATRSFSDEVNRQDRDNPMYAHPDDYDLYFLGGFDETTGVFESEGPPSLIVRGKDVSQKG